MYLSVNEVAAHLAPAPDVPHAGSNGLLAYMVEYEVAPDEWQPAGWFRAFREAMLVASAFERARVRLVEL
jgi:hypothetical protein